jgi:hypothetical protein
MSAGADRCIGEGEGAGEVDRLGLAFFGDLPLWCGLILDFGTVPYSVVGRSENIIRDRRSSNLAFKFKGLVCARALAR